MTGIFSSETVTHVPRCTILLRFYFVSRVTLGIEGRPPAFGLFTGETSSEPVRRVKGRVFNC